MAPSRMLYGKYFSRYEFLKIYLWKLRIEFFFIFYDFEKDQNRSVFMFVWACKYKKTCLWAYLLICEGVFEHFSSFSSFSSVCFSDLKCDKWINVLIHVWACKYKKACQWAELLICEGVFEYSSSFSSFSLLFFLILKQIKKCYDLSMQI